MIVHLRPFREEDAASLAEYANNEKIAANLTDAFPHPYSIEDARKFIDMTLEHDPARVFAIDIDGRASGGIGIHPRQDIHRKNMELGYWLAEPFWGIGIISRLIPEIVNYGFATFDITRIFAVPFGRNKASARVLEKCGFTLEAHLEKTIIKLGEFDDELIYAVRKETWEQGPFNMIVLP